MKDLSKHRWFVKIVAGKQQALSECVYYRRDLRFETVMKWMWYFKYREAAYRVRNPRHFCELRHGSYEYVPPVEEEIQILKNKIRHRKGKVTELDSKLRMAKQAWTELFPIEENEFYKKAIAKIDKVRKEYQEFLHQLDEAVKKIEV